MHCIPRPHSFLAAAVAAAMLSACIGGGGGGGSAGASGTPATGGSSGSSGGTSSTTVSRAASVQFVSSTPDVIVLAGGEGETQAEVKFLVKDALNKPLAGETVTFELSTAVGGIRLQQGSAVSDSDGTVTAHVLAGNIPTPVRVTAKAGVASAQSGQLSISTGLPHQNGFSISVSDFSPAMFNTDGVSTTITARASSRLGNPVPDGTTINFVTEGGIGTIQPSCKTSGGSCSVTLSSSGERSSLVDRGRQTILAYMLGEESFNDANSNGRYDAGESFNDLPEPFINARPGVARSGPQAQTWNTVAGDPYSEYYVDFNSNGIHDGNGNGTFDGVARADGKRSTVYIWRNVEIIWGKTSITDIAPADGNPGENSSVVNYKGDTLTWLSNVALCTAGSLANTTVSYRAMDDTGNPLPSGTTIAFSVSSNGAATASARIIGTASFTASKNVTEPDLFNITLALPTGASSCPASAPDTLELRITPPGGTAISRSYNIF